VTLGEFLHPLAKASQRDLVLATLYYLERYEDKDAVTTTEIKAAFTKAKHARGKKIQLAAVLNQAVPYVHVPAGKVAGQRLLWALTDSGKKHVRDLLKLPASEPEVEHDVGTLQAVAARIPDDQARSYVEEAITCLQVGALRASVVFLWTGAVAVLRDGIWNHGAKSIDGAIKVHRPKAPDFKKKDDFGYVNDALLLQVAQDLAIVDKTQKQRLGEALDLRNGCGHVSKYSPGVKKVSSFIEDVVGIVWS
jgi:hypothetical protein